MLGQAQQADLVYVLTGIVVGAMDAQDQRYGAGSRRIVEYILGQVFKPGLDVLARLGSIGAEAVFVPADHGKAASGHAGGDVGALTEGIGRLVVAQALIGSSRTVQARLAHRQAHGFDKQAVVGIVYIPCITQAAVRCHHTLQRQLLVVTGHGVGSLLGHVYTVDGAILPDNVLTGIDQVHGAPAPLPDFWTPWCH